MPLYEHVMIARQDLSNTQAEGLIEHFGTVLADNGGKLVDQEYWGVKTMAYKINKNRKALRFLEVRCACTCCSRNGTPNAPA